MSDQKKPTDSSSTESAATEEPGKEMNADELENVAGGLLPASGETTHKFFRPSPTGDGTTQIKWAGEDGIKEALPAESVSLNFTKK